MLRAGCNLGPTGKKSPSSSIYFVLVSPPSVAPLLHSVVIPPWGLLLFQNGHLRHGVRPSFCPSLGSNEGVWCFHSALPQGHVPPFAALPHPIALGAAFHSPSTAVQAPFEPKLQSLRRPWEVRTPSTTKDLLSCFAFFSQIYLACTELRAPKSQEKHSAQIHPAAPSMVEPNPAPRIPHFLTALGACWAACAGGWLQRAVL